MNKNILIAYKEKTDDVIKFDYISDKLLKQFKTQVDLIATEMTQSDLKIIKGRSQIPGNKIILKDKILVIEEREISKEEISAMKAMAFSKTLDPIMASIKAYEVTGEKEKLKDAKKLWNKKREEIKKYFEAYKK